MSKSGYIVTTEGLVVVTTTAHCILGVIGTSGFGVDLTGFHIDFDGVDATQKPILVEIARCTFATNPPGTNSTNLTEIQTYGPAATPGFIGAKDWTAEPTVFTTTIFKSFSLDPNKGLFDYDWALGQTPDTPVDDGFVMRCTVPAGGISVNARAEFRFERA